MRKVDDTKDSIRVDALGTEERKKLFGDLTRAGGQVINERPKTIVIDRSKQREYRERLDRHARNMQALGNAKPRQQAARPQNTPRPRVEVPTLTFWEEFKIRFRLRFTLKVCKPGYNFFTDKFMYNFFGIYKAALLEAKVQHVDLFKKNIQEGNRITAHLDEQKQLFYEVIEIASSIYDMMPDDEGLDEILVSDMEDTIMRVYHNLSLISPYENTLFNAYVKAIELCRTRDITRYPSPQSQKTKIKDALYVIFNQLYPRLHWLACLYKHRYITRDDLAAIEALCEIAPSEKPGTLRLTGRKVKEDLALEEAKKPVKTKVDDIASHVRTGLNLMTSFDYKAMRAQFDSKGVFEVVEDNDKVLVTFLIFSEFVREYAFILNTNKIKFTTIIADDGTFNYSSIMKDMYYEMNKPMASLRNYAEVTQNFLKINQEKPLNSSHYIAYSKRLQEIITRRQQTGKMARMQIKAFMEKLSDIMKKLSDNINTSGDVIINPQDKLKLDNSIEGTRKLNNKTIREAIYQCYCFCSAFVYRLSTQGDLYQGLEFSPEDKNKIHQLVSSPDENTEAPTAENLEGSPKANENKSLLDELSDLI